MKTIPPVFRILFSGGHSLLNHRRNDILEEINIDPVEKKLAQYKQKRLNYVSRMKGIRYAKQVCNYRAIRRRT
jgi:hypothetical protein